MKRRSFIKRLSLALVSAPVVVEAGTHIKEATTAINDNYIKGSYSDSDITKKVMKSFLKGFESDRALRKTMGDSNLRIGK